MTVQSSTTPRPGTAPQSIPPPQHQTMDDATTPTRATFGSNAMAHQKPLPNSSFPEDAKVPEDTADKKGHKRNNSQNSKRSRDSAEMMDVDESDNDTAGEESDGEGSVNADGTRSSKKKKGNQRFYCRDYPPCTLSFTRSEHLARHIRKHTGERPFQCHCQRRFSRLDNLRQHAQTVHVNEDIPYDSLAATGTRYQRQIRTDRVQRGGRARASTASSVGAPPRGHSKSLSTSSIASISSLGSAYGTRDDIRRRPPPLVMADPNARLSAESYRSVGSTQFPYRQTSPSDYSTPTSATFSTGQSSPRWGSVVGSPVTSYSRHAMYPSGSRTPGRRLSVPSGGNPFQSPLGPGGLGRPIFGPGPLNTSNSAALSSPVGSYLGSPTTSAGGWSRRESISSTAEEAWRRRTWHPDSSNFTAPGSRLSQVITSSQLNAGPEPLPAMSSNAPQQHQQPQQQQQTVRLPGIDSLLPRPGQPLAVPSRGSSPMMIDRSHGPPLLPSANISDERRNMPQWDMGLHRGLTRLDINNNTTPPPARDGAGVWASEVRQAMDRVEQPRQYQPTVRFEPEPQIVHPPRQQPPPPTASHIPPSGPSRSHQHTMSAPLVSTNREIKRHGWYNGPVTVHEDRVLEARPHVDRLEHPNLHAFTGFPARGGDSDRRPADNPDSRRFDALVAVATGESTATAC
ncbi:hypothetical protein M406DRAFT_347292 [Cryphonectria parasitica EP155]|uniref:C2H2-type domain-containing protein n=1 Tax=Cryphonectria parasitica (strain ATCC 38755 / EP155) TaxID=660469 RepID=A0A9P5CLZ4_CRYP1|nr:uncharacterized protein M406DRAFT_347292 [Cryphonectria parasitica EP155]KAF3763834.1 hypothetical protein M406DRAFT_347292 [Cryphonectria parasitica EP155]